MLFQFISITGIFTSARWHYCIVFPAKLLHQAINLISIKMGHLSNFLIGQPWFSPTCPFHKHTQRPGFGGFPINSTAMLRIAGTGYCLKNCWLQGPVGGAACSVPASKRAALVSFFICRRPRAARVMLSCQLSVSIIIVCYEQTAPTDYLKHLITTQS